MTFRVTYHIDRSMAAKIIRLHRPKDAEAIIRALALDSANVQITLHAFERMEERGFTTTDLFRVLTTGMVTGTPIETNTAILPVKS